LFIEELNLIFDKSLGGLQTKSLSISPCSSQGQALYERERLGFSVKGNPLTDYSVKDPGGLLAMTRRKFDFYTYIYVK
jgi:hypothetical protein